MDKNQDFIDKLKCSLHGNAADALAERIRAMIISGEIPAGFTFPSENVFCEQINVSRSTLREAYKALESTGFISRVKRLGTKVNDYSDISKASPLGTSMIMSSFGELMEFRVMIEVELARLAAQRATDENIRSIRSSLLKMHKSEANLMALTYYDTQFHMEIAKASGNRLLISTMENAKDVFQNGIYQAFQVDTRSNVTQALQFHARILDAIISRDSDLAYSLMRQHLESINQRVG